MIQHFKTVLLFLDTTAYVLTAFSKIKWNYYLMYIHVLYAKFFKVLKVYWGTFQGLKFFVANKLILFIYLKKKDLYWNKIE